MRFLRVAYAQFWSQQVFCSSAPLEQLCKTENEKTCSFEEVETCPLI